MSENNNLTSGGNAAFHNYMNDFAHIEDPVERRRLALEAMDSQGFGFAQVKIIMVAGVGFLCDAYDIFAINLATTMLTHVYWDGNIPASTETLLKVSTSIGTIIGQIGFGTLGDVLGRSGVYGLELIIVIISCLIQCILGESPAVNFVAIFTFFRIIMGIGIGGDYPLSSIITSEFSTTKWRGAIMGAVFANQGWGQLLAGLVALIVVAGFKSDLDSTTCDDACKKACDIMWRILVGFGCVPACSALYFRLTLPESPRATVDETPEEDGEETKKVGPTFFQHFGKWRHGKILLGTAGCWFMLDVAYYGLGLNTATILQAIGYASSNNVYLKLYNAAAGNLILVCAGSIPGYWVAVGTIDTVGRKPIQIMGFALLTILLAAIGFAYNKLSEGGLLGLYIVAQFFQNFGPNVTTFIVPGEVFPAKFRSTAHGISAASGKLGAIIAQTAIGTLVNHGCAPEHKNCFLPHVMEIFACFMLLGFILSFLIPETKRKTLEQLSEELHGEVGMVGAGVVQQVSATPDENDNFSLSEKEKKEQLV